MIVGAGITGCWNGMITQPEGPKGYETYPIFFELRMEGHIVVGTATFAYDNHRSVCAFGGGFVEGRFLQLDYIDTDPLIVRYGTNFCALSSDSKTLKGRFLGYATELNGLAWGEVELGRVNGTESFLQSAKAVETATSPRADKSIPQKFHHVSLPVNDLRASVSFYTNDLGLREIPRPDLGFRINGAWFQLPNGQQLHLLENPKGTFRSKDAPLDHNDCHFALRVPDVGEIYKRLKLRGNDLKMNPDILFSSYPHFYILDPDNHIIEINGENVSDKTINAGGKEPGS